jgi:predicted PurR-regulated permease PerM
MPESRLVAVLVGSDLAGVLGALAAIPVAGTPQILLAELGKRTLDKL